VNDFSGIPLALIQAQGGHGPGGHGQVDFMGALFVFLLATFVGLMAIQRVSRLLHTPLVAIFCSVTNIVSGFLITDRMLKMFKKREGAAK